MNPNKNNNNLNNMMKFGFPGFPFNQMQNENVPYMYQPGMFPNPLANMIAAQQQNMKFQAAK